MKREIIFNKPDPNKIYLDQITGEYPVIAVRRDKIVATITKTQKVWYAVFIGGYTKEVNNLVVGLKSDSFRDCKFYELKDEF